MLTLAGTGRVPSLGPPRRWSADLSSLFSLGPGEKPVFFVCFVFFFPFIYFKIRDLKLALLAQRASELESLPSPSRQGNELPFATFLQTSPATKRSK